MPARLVKAFNIRNKNDAGDLVGRAATGQVITRLHLIKMLIRRFQQFDIMRVGSAGDE